MGISLVEAKALDAGENCRQPSFDAYHTGTIRRHWPARLFTGVLVPLLLMVVSTSCSKLGDHRAAVTSPEPGSGVKVRIAAWNVEYGKSATPEMIAKALKAYRLDVIGFCEVPEGDWTARVGRVLGLPYAYVGQVSSAGHKDKYKSILSRYPLAKTREYPLKESGWIASVVKGEIEVGGETITLMSLHLNGWRQKEGSQIHYLFKDIIPELNADRVVVMGDFNQTTNDIAFEATHIPDMIPIWTDLNIAQYTPPAWDPKWGRAADYIIDHILYNRSSNGHVLQGGIIELDPPLSDHNPVWAEIEFPAATSTYTPQMWDCSVDVLAHAVTRLSGEQKPALLEMRLNNYGSGTIQGKVIIDAGESAETLGSPEIQYELAGGKAMTRGFAVKLKPGQARAVISARHSRGVSSATVLMRQECGIQKHSAQPDLARLSDVLATAKKYQFKSDGLTVGEASFALVGSNLGLDVLVYDRQVAATEKAWRDSPQGTQVELFCSMPYSKVIRQLFFDPKSGKGTQRLKQNTILIDEPEVPCEISLLKDAGYRVKAIVPLSLMALDPDAKEILLELAITLTPTAEHRYWFNALFGSSSPNRDNGGFAIFRVKE